MGSLVAFAAGGRGLAACAAGLALSLAVSTGAMAQNDAETIQDLLKKLEERDRKLEQRDALIADLLRRVELLEQHVGANAPQTVLTVDQALAAASPVADDIRPVATVVTPLSRLRAQTAMGEDEAAQGSAQTQGSEQEAQGQAPGQVEVEEEDVERALERTLVQAGALLLPFGSVAIEPSFAYTRRESDSPLLVAQAGLISAAEQEIRRNEFDTNVDLRIGLPLDAQLEFALPYRVVNQETVNNLNAAPISEVNDTGNGIGDVSVGLAKTFLRESGWQPDLIGRVTWDSDTADQNDNGVPLGGGFHEIRGSVTALKRQDPLAFVASASYETAFESDNIDPGDSVSLSLAGILAASPETSLRFVFDQSFVGEVEVGGARVDGSDQVIGALTLGAATILGPGVLLDVAGSIGLTEDAADYAIVVSVPVRFNTGLE